MTEGWRRDECSLTAGERFVDESGVKGELVLGWGVQEGLCWWGSL